MSDGGWLPSQPDVYIEEKDMAIFKTASDKVKSLGRLHKLWKTKQVTQVEIAKEGLHVLYWLNKKPHWQDR